MHQDSIRVLIGWIRWNRWLLSALLALAPLGEALAQWPIQFGSPSTSEQVTDVAVDSAGNTLVLGTFTGVISLPREGQPPLELAAQGGQDIFVVKYDSSGQVVWAQRGGGPSADTARSLVVDQARNIYVSGWGRDDLAFGGTLIPGSYVGQAFVAKLDPAGNWIWGKGLSAGNFIDIDVHPTDGAVLFSGNGQVGRLRSDTGSIQWTLSVPGFVQRAIAVGQGGRIFVKGVVPLNTGGTVCGKSFAPYDASDRDNPDTAGVIVTLIQETRDEADGSFSAVCQWAERIDWTGIDGGLATDGTDAYAVAAGRVVRVSSAGTVIFSETLDRDAFTTPLKFQNEQRDDIAVDEAGNIYITGKYMGEPVFGGAPEPEHRLPAADVPTPYVAKLSPSRQWLWAVAPGDRLDHPKVSSQSIGSRLALGPGSTVHLSGEFTGFARFGAERLESQDLLSDGALTFDGNDDYLLLPAELLANEDFLTIEVKVKVEPDAPVRWWTLLSAATAQTNEALMLYFPNPQTLEVWEDGLPRASFSLPDMGVAAINDGQWRHLAFMRVPDADSVQYRFKVGGSGVFAQDVPCWKAGDFACYYLRVADGGLIIGQEQDSLGGGFNPSQSFVGHIDELAFWNKVLSNEEVNAHVNSPIRASASNLRAYWSFDDPFASSATDGNPVEDLSPNAYDFRLSDLPPAARPGRVPGAYSGVTRTVDNMETYFEGPRDGYVALLDANGGNWLTPEIWTVGQTLEPPILAQSVDQGASGPVVEIDGLAPGDTVASYLYWNRSVQKLYSVRPAPGVVTVKWSLADGSQAAVIGTPALPPDTQFHVAGTSLALEPAQDATGPLRFVGVAHPPPPASNQIVVEDPDAGPIFTRAKPGPGDAPYVVLHYVRTATPDTEPSPDLAGGPAQESVFQVVYTVDWNDPAVLANDDTNKACIIGQPLGDPRHADPTGANGRVALARARYDAGIYDPTTRRGPIIPVNEDEALDPNDDMAVTWFVPNAIGVAWPDTSATYECTWPGDAQTIVIASQQGSGPLPANFVDRSLYNQPDPTLPGYNPNEEHALLADADGQPGLEVFALRDDLNGTDANGLPKASKPFVLLRYRDASQDNRWGFRVFRVVATDATYDFSPTDNNGDGLYEWGEDNYVAEAGQLIPLPKGLPPNTTTACSNRIVLSPHPDSDPNSPAWRDRNGQLYARADTDAAQAPEHVDLSIRYWYPLLPDFYYPTGVPPLTCVPWLGGITEDGIGETAIGGGPVSVDYAIHWPADAPVLRPGETLATRKEDVNGNFLPEISRQAAVRIVYDEAAAADPDKALVALFDPISPRKVALPLTEFLASGVRTASRDGRLVFPDLPFHLRQRLSYDETAETLAFSGCYIDGLECSSQPPDTGRPRLLPNYLTDRERAVIVGMTTDSHFRGAVEALYDLTRLPKPEPDGLAGQDTPKILSAGRAEDKGFVTLAFNDDADAEGPVGLQVMRVDCPLNRVYQGDVWVVPSDNVFEEALTLRFSGDFAGDPALFGVDFEWWYQPDTAGQPNAPASEPPASPWMLHTSETGAIDITIRDPRLTLSDNWFMVRYKNPRFAACGNDIEPSDWAGDPNTDPARAMLATGWVKRVVDGVNPFDQRVSDFRESEVNTISSMIAQAGARYVGPIALNPDPDAVNSVGLIEAYQTVLERAKDLSIRAGYNDIAANTQLLNVATRVADMYTLLGNEAYADAQDPTIGFDTGGEYGSLASSMFAFQNQLSSPLEEELTLLRGRDDARAGVAAYPVYNRLFWNCTGGLGEVAYVQTYGIGDQDAQGFDCEADSESLFPQGHGDAWGHYLTAMKSRYALLREPNYTWIPRTESVVLADGAIEVDFLDERKFAGAAAAKARAGAELVNLTYRDRYVEAPAGQWQGYKDTNGDRAWGVDGWARRAGQGAYFDWLTANAILPAEDPDPSHEGIARVERGTVPELVEISTQFSAIEAQVQAADAGLNPVGLAKGVVPFDIDPVLVLRSNFASKTHFEQVAERAEAALGNALRVFDHANQQTQRLRAQQDDVDQLTRSVAEQERDYKNRLIEIYGLPFAGTIGGAGPYPADYDGPDLEYFNYVSSDLLVGDKQQPDTEFTTFRSPIDWGDACGAYYPGDNDADLPEFELRSLARDTCTDDELIPLTQPVVQGADWPWVARSSWGKRGAPGEIQVAISALLQSQAQLQRAQKAYDNLLDDITAAAELARMQAANYDIERGILVQQKNRIQNLNQALLNWEIGRLVATRVGQVARDVAAVAAEGPDSLDDILALGKYTIMSGAFAAANIAEAVGDVASGFQFGLEQDKEAVALQAELAVFTQTNDTALADRVRELEQLVRNEAVLRLELLDQAEKTRQALGAYLQVRARGDRLQKERALFRLRTAADIQQYRYRDMTFRVFRNDALQKYRAQFDLAARYVYLAAAAYDYETNLLGGDNGAGRDFLADIVRQRSLGQVIDGVPVAGTPGLADVLARLDQNFAVYKGQLGFNNPQTETNRFSLRRELLRIRDGSDDSWRDALEQARVDNLWDIPEFRRFARPFTLESLGPQPGLVFRFPTTVTFGMNFFGHALGGGDSAYDPTNFATKVRSVGTWFAEYDGTGLSNTPRVYLFPVGMDVLRSPTGDTLATREWRVIDQKLPVPFPIGASDLADPAWIPLHDSLSDTYADVRRFSSYRAYHDSGAFSEAETVSDSRLIGRSVWNTEWMLVIPGGTLLFDGEEGLDRFIHGRLVPGSLDQRDGNGVSDIKLFFQTYGYSGN
jgi:hypothetical protein